MHNRVVRRGRLGLSGPKGSKDSPRWNARRWGRRDTRTEGFIIVGPSSLMQAADLRAPSLPLFIPLNSAHG